MKKIFLLMLTIIIALGITLCGCSSDQSKDNSWEDIKESGKFIVGLDDEFPPMGFRDENNNLTGFDVEMAKAVAEKMDIEVEFQPIDWDSKIMELNNKNIDVIWNGLTITEDRKEKMGFTKPYMKNRQIIVVMGDSEINSKADLSDKVVGVQADSSGYDALKADETTLNSLKEVIEYNNFNEALMDLPTGRIDAVIIDEIVGRYYISKKGEGFNILEDNFGSEEYGVGLRKTDVAFLEELQKGLDAMDEDGTADAIANKWFNENIVK